MLTRYLPSQSYGVKCDKALRPEGTHHNLRQIAKYIRIIKENVSYVPRKKWSNNDNKTTEAHAKHCSKGTMYTNSYHQDPMK